MHNRGKFWTKDTKRPKKKKTNPQKTPAATFEEPRAKAGGWEQKQGNPHAPGTQHHLSRGK